MSKKVISFLVSLIILISSGMTGFAQESKDVEFATQRPAVLGEKDETANSKTAKNNGRVIVLDINRTSLCNFEEINFLRKKMMDEGSIGMMNIRGDKGYEDRRNYASMGATGRVNIQDVPLQFEENNKKKEELYKAATGQNPGKINLVNINRIDQYNQARGDFKSQMGYLAETLISDNKKVTALGNSDYYNLDGKKISNKDFALSVMDSKGRIFYGNVNHINTEDANYPFGIKTDYNKLLEETKKAYTDTNLIFVNLGDTYRLDEYKVNLNDETYKEMQSKIYADISKYMEEVFKLANKNDTIYVMSSFPSKLDYSNNRRLAPVVRFDNAPKGVLKSSTTRRKGVIGNLDIGVDILNRFGLKNKAMVGRKIVSIPMDENITYINNEFKKIVSISSIRMSLINIYVSFISISWIIAALALWQRKRIPLKYRESTLGVLKELVKFGLIMPLAFLTTPIFKVQTEMGIAVSIILASIIYYIAARKIFKDDDIKQIGFYALIMIALITVDSAISTPLMQSNIMSYDPMIGARYYGVGNEYEGVTIGSAILAFAVLLECNKIKKPFVAAFLFVILVISANPRMGANVGGAISECIAYLAFVLLVYDVKINFKKSILIVLSAGVLVAIFAVADLALGMGSHLGNFVEKIMVNGPMEIVNVFVRKIEMNIHLAQTTVWVHILIVGLIILAITIFRPNKNFEIMKKEYKYIYKGFLATIIGCLVTLLVNDSGIIAAATDSIYLLIPIIILLINKKVKEKRNIC